MARWVQVALLMLVPLAGSDRALAQPSRLALAATPGSVYRVSLAVDLPVSAVAGLSVIIPYALSSV